MHWWFMIMTDFVASSIQSFRFFFCQIVIYSPPCNFHVIMHALKKIVIIGFEFSRAKKKKCVKYFFITTWKFHPLFPHFCRFSSDKMFGHMPSWKAGTITNCSGLSSLAAHDFSHILHCNRKLDFLIFEATPPMNYRSAELLLRTVVH